jgi:hypothetical protein
VQGIDKFAPPEGAICYSQDFSLNAPGHAHAELSPAESPVSSTSLSFSDENDSGSSHGVLSSSGGYEKNEKGVRLARMRLDSANDIGISLLE